MSVAHRARLALVVAMLSVVPTVLARPALASAAGRLAGVVQDEKGTLMSGATVSLQSGTTAVAQATTDASGQYSVAVPADEYDVEVKAPSGDRFWQARVNDVTVDGDAVLDIALARTVRFQGTVRSGDGSPVEGVTVQMTGSGASMRTGPDGAFSLDVLAGTYDLEVIRSTVGSLYTALYARVPEFHISADQTVDLLFPLQAFDIAVTSEAGVPVPGATVGFGNGYTCLCPSNFELLAGHPAMVSVSANVKTDPGGVAHVVGLPARDLSVQASAPTGAGFEPYNEILEFGATAPSAITVVLRSTAALEGFVTAPTGGPARFPFVQLSDGRSSTFYGRYSGSDGRYATDHPPGRYQVEISSSTGSGNTTDHARAYVSEFDLPASGRNQSFTIPGATFPVQVVDSAGDAVAGASVFVSSGSRGQGDVPVDLAPGLRGGATNQSSRVTGADGMANTVMIAGTPTVSVSVQPPTGAPLRPYSASVAPSSAGLVVRLPSTVRVNGIVRDAGGTPIAGLTVGVSAADGTGGGSTATAGDGSYTVSAPSGPGTLYLRRNDAAATAHLPSGQWYFTTDVDLTGPRTVNVTTPPPSTADVLVVDEDGARKSGVLAVYGTTAIDVSLGSGLTGKLGFSYERLEGDGAFRAMLFAGGKHRLSWYRRPSPFRT